MAKKSSSLLLFLLFVFSSHSFSVRSSAFHEVNLQNPVVQFSPLSNGGFSCERVHITGISRLNLKKYPSLIRVTLNASEGLSERLREKIQVCFHRNVTRGLCQCQEGSWESLQKGQWVSAISAYSNRFVDVRVNDKASMSFSISMDEEFQEWRLAFLVLGVILFLSAPIVSDWVPFYYSSSMALGVVLVVLIILFQGMKLLPTGRKNVLYLTIYGSVLGAGSYIAHYFSTMVNSILVNFGFNEDMHSPVSVLLVVLIVLSGAALGYWIVRKYVLSEEGIVDAGIAQFVKWAIRILAAAFIFQSTLDVPLSLVVLAAAGSVSFLITSGKWRHGPKQDVVSWQRKTKQVFTNHRQPEFYSPPKMSMVNNAWGNSSSPYALSKSPVKVVGTPSSHKRGAGAGKEKDYYSSFHKLRPNKFSKKEWEDFTHESTSSALADWASTPEVAKWLAENAQRMQLRPESDSDDTAESSSDSSEETVENNCGLNLFRW